MKSFKRSKEEFTNVFNSYLTSNTNFSTISSLQTATSPQSLSKTLSHIEKCVYFSAYVSFSFKRSVTSASAWKDSC